MYESKTSLTQGMFLDSRISYMMTKPTNFLQVSYYYGPTGTVYASFFPESVDTKGKISTPIYDDRERFSSKSGISLLDSFKKTLEVMYSFIDLITTNMDTDVVAKLHSNESIPLAYFYQGEYHLQEE